MTGVIRISRERFRWTLRILNTGMPLTTLKGRLQASGRIIITEILTDRTRICAISACTCGVRIPAANAWAAILFPAADQVFNCRIVSYFLVNRIIREVFAWIAQTSTRTENLNAEHAK